jgi:hypothetical protein
MRLVQTLAPQQRATSSILGQRVVLGHNPQLVSGGKNPPSRMSRPRASRGSGASPVFRTWAEFNRRGAGEGRLPVG